MVLQNQTPPHKSSWLHSKDTTTHTTNGKSILNCTHHQPYRNIVLPYSAVGRRNTEKTNELSVEKATKSWKTKTSSRTNTTIRTSTLDNIKNNNNNKRSTSKGKSFFGSSSVLKQLEREFQIQLICLPGWIVINHLSLFSKGASVCFMAMMFILIKLVFCFLILESFEYIKMVNQWKWLYFYIRKIFIHIA